SLYKKWYEADQQLTLHRGRHAITQRRVIGEYAPAHDAESEQAEPIANLIVTLPAAHVVRVIGRIRHRLDHRSTICLVNDGLGVAEELIKTYFPNELERPVFLLGHFTAALDHTEDRFS